jgi:hypothetical protein
MAEAASITGAHVTRALQRISGHAAFVALPFPVGVLHVIALQSHCLESIYNKIQNI